MHQWTVLLVAIALVACSTNGAINTDLVDAENDVRMTVRKVEIASDVVTIRPDYQIVIGASTRLMPTDRWVTWEKTGQSEARRVNTTPAPGRTQSLPVVQRASKNVKSIDQTLFLNEAHFDFGSASLSSKAKELLDQAAAEMQQLSPKRLSVIGHTDSIGNEVANQRLSERRAEAVFAYLKTKGVNVDAVERVGFGERAPAADNATTEGRKKNRRAEIMATVSKQEK